ASSAALAELSQVPVGSLTLPSGLQGVTFGNGTIQRTVSLVGTTATVLNTLRTSLVDFGATVVVQGTGAATDPWMIQLNGYNTALPITADYDFGQFIDVTPDVVVIPALQINASDVVVGTQILAGNQSILLLAADISTVPATQASLLQTRLRTLPGLTAVEVTFDSSQYYLNFAAAETLQVEVIAAANFSLAFSTAGLAEQTILGSEIVSHSAFRVGTSDIVTLSDADINTTSTAAQALLLQTRLRTLSALQNINVEYYSAGKFLFRFADGATRSALSFVSGSSATALGNSELALGKVNLAENVQSVRLSFNGISRIFQRAGFNTPAAALADLQAKLDDLSPGSAVHIDDSLLATLGYQITIEGYNPFNPLVVTIDNGDFPVLTNNAIALYKIVQQREEQDGEIVWETLTQGAGTTASPVVMFAYGDTDAVSGDDLYISPVMTVEQLGPKMIEKPTWERDASGTLVQTGQTELFQSDETETDHAVDQVTITGTSLSDYFLIGHERVPLGGLDASGQPEYETRTDTVQVTHRLLNTNGTVNDRKIVIKIRGIDLTTPDFSRDEIVVNAANGDDRLVAGLLPKAETNSALQVGLYDILWGHATDLLSLNGGAGDDRIVGTNQADIIDSGSGDDVVTGGAGVDTFVDASGNDTLQEVRNLNFLISDAEFRVTGQEPDLLDPSLNNSINESEVPDSTDPTHRGIGVFERFEIFGGAGVNSFAVTAFTKNAWLDGTEGSDSYVVTLTGTINLASNVYVRDTGTGGRDTDSLQMTGGDGDDTLHLDADTSHQEILQKTAEAFTLTYHGLTTGSLSDSATASDVRTALMNLQSAGVALFTDVTVERLGQSGSYQWFIVLQSTNADAQNVEGKFFRLGTTATGYDVRVSRSAVTRITSGTSGLLEGKPDVDGMFEGVAFETQLYNVLTGRTGSYKLSYNNVQSTLTLTETSTAADVEAALQSISGIQDATVTGSGTNRDPFRIKLESATKDTKGNFLPITTTNTTVVTTPMQIADAAAVTRLSGSVATPVLFQRVYYDRTAETIAIGGGEGNDTFIVDDSMAQLEVSGDEGDDNFIIGRVIKTTTVTVDGQAVEVIDGDDGVTPGVSYNANFFGGGGDDYFEVNHNIGELALFGEAGDDMFFLKALLQAQGSGLSTSTSEVTGGGISAGAGDANNNIGDGESNTLVNYLENNRVQIFGGSGFDTVVVAGTQLADTFYIFTDVEERQYLYGAGLKLENIQQVERLALVAGAGNDVIYLYGLKPTISLLINTGTGDDQVVIGGEQRTIPNVRFPESSAVYTVQQNLVTDHFDSMTTLNNKLQFVRSSANFGESQQVAFRNFYNKWVKSLSGSDLANLTIDKVHWALLEANLAVALKLYAQAIELATSTKPVRALSATAVVNIPSGATSAQRADALRAAATAAANRTTEFINTVNTLEQALNTLNSSRWSLQTLSTQVEYYGFLNLSKRTTYSSSLNWGLLNNAAPRLPARLDYETLNGLVKDSELFSADGRTLDQILFQEYLRNVVA
ncbi:MAG: hypothetical protein WCK86_19815, partial [Planctomycetia bacterium]